MRRLRADNATRSTSLGDRIRLADGWWSRLRGLIGSPPLEPGEGMLLRPCRGVHMYGMRQALDVALLDADGRVVALYPELEPGRRTPWHREARQALELPPGALAAAETRIGDRLVLEPAAVSDRPAETETATTTAL